MAAMINLQTRTQALHFSGKMYAFLVSPRQKRLNTLGQKQYLVGEVGENCLIQV